MISYSIYFCMSDRIYFRKSVDLKPIFDFVSLLVKQKKRAFGASSFNTSVSVKCILVLFN